ncbi:MAG: M56 family metallopeptidase [Bacteroidota bacterium]
MAELNLLHDWTNSLGWTALHSLWQFALVAIICSLILRVLRKSSADLRFWVGYASLLLCLALAVFTFVSYLPESTAPELSSVQSLLNPDAAPQAVETGLSAAPELSTPSAEISSTTSTSWWVNSWNYLSSQVHWIGTFWIIGLLFFGVRFGIGIWGIHRLRKEGLVSPSDEWMLRFQQLLHATRSYRGIGFSLSERISGPVTIGFLRPLVLLPVGLLAQLPPDQVEAILLHEIAHVRRHDYLLNLLQRAILAFFFYHPGLHMIGRWIDRERENACDDFVVFQNNNPRSLVRALAFLSLQPNCGQPQLALAATGQKGQILPRLNRLIDLNNSKKTMNANRFFLLLLLLPLAGLLLASRARPAEVPSLKMGDLNINLVPDCPEVVTVDTVPPSALERQVRRLATVEERLAAQEQRLREQEELLAQREAELEEREREIQYRQNESWAPEASMLEEDELLSEYSELSSLEEALLAASTEEIINKLNRSGIRTGTAIEEVVPQRPRFVISPEMETKLNLEAFGPEVERSIDPVSGSVVYTGPYGYYFSLNGDQVEFGPEEARLPSGDYADLHQELRSMLLGDGLMESNDCVAVLHISPGNIVVNDETLSGRKAARYDALLRRYDLEKAPGRQIRVEPKRLKIGYPGDEECSWVGSVWLGES